MVEKRDQELKFVIGRVNMEILEGVHLVVLFLSRKHKPEKGSHLLKATSLFHPTVRLLFSVKNYRSLFAKGTIGVLF